jgi:hypothetical protein
MRSALVALVLAAAAACGRSEPYEEQGPPDAGLCSYCPTACADVRDTFVPCCREVPCSELDGGDS